MIQKESRLIVRERRHARVRENVSGTSECPRLVVFRSNKNIEAQIIDDIKGLIKQSPTIGWGLMIGSLAILGMPPFGVFTSEFMLLTTAIKHYPWAAPILLIALGVAFATMFHKVQGMVFGEPTVQPLSHNPALLPVFTHLGLVLMLGLWIPPYLAEWYRLAARLIG